MVTIGVFIYVVVTFSKPILLSPRKDFSIKVILDSMLLNFRRDHSESTLSLLQLLGISWIGVGFFEILLQTFQPNTPELLLSFLEIGIPLSVIIIVIYLNNK